MTTHSMDSGTDMNEEHDTDIKHNISSTTTWGRALFMILFAIIYSVAEIVLITVVVIQFCFVLISGDKNQRLLIFGRELSQFIYQVFLYLTFNEEEKPFPFDNWPSTAGNQPSQESEADFGGSETGQDKPTEGIEAKDS